MRYSTAPREGWAAGFRRFHTHHVNTRLGQCSREGSPLPSQPVEQGRGPGVECRCPWAWLPDAGALARGQGSWAGLLSPVCLPVFLPFGALPCTLTVRILKQRRRAVCRGGSMTPSLVTPFCCLSFAVSCHVCFLEAPFLTSPPVPWGVSGLVLPGLRVCCRLGGRGGSPVGGAGTASPAQPGGPRACPLGAGLHMGRRGRRVFWC